MISFKKKIEAGPNILDRPLKKLTMDRHCRVVKSIFDDRCPALVTGPATFKLIFLAVLLDRSRIVDCLPAIH
jgi:hypothetical protein